MPVSVRVNTRCLTANDCGYPCTVCSPRSCSRINVLACASTRQRTNAPCINVTSSPEPRPHMYVRVHVLRSCAPTTRVPSGLIDRRSQSSTGYVHQDLPTTSNYPIMPCIPAPFKISTIVHLLSHTLEANEHPRSLHRHLHLLRRHPPIPIQWHLRTVLWPLSVFPHFR